MDACAGYHPVQHGRRHRQAELQRREPDQERELAAAHLEGDWRRAALPVRPQERQGPAWRGWSAPLTRPGTPPSCTRACLHRPHTHPAYPLHATQPNQQFCEVLQRAPLHSVSPALMLWHQCLPLGGLVILLVLQCYAPAHQGIRGTTNARGTVMLWAHYLSCTQ